MVRNRNGYWMSKRFLLSPDGAAGGGGGTAAPAGDGGAGGEATPAGNDPQNGGADGTNPSEDAKALAAQIEQLKADMQKQKEALDKATSEAGKYRKELQSKMTQEQIDEENKKEAAEKAAKELADLRREMATVKSTKSVMAKLGISEESATKIAESLVGCENIENALLLIQKEWTAKEKALRLEFGKIPGPGAGGSSEEDAEEKAAIELAKKLGRARAESDKSVSAGMKGYIR